MGKDYSNKYLVENGTVQFCSVMTNKVSIGLLVLRYMMGFVEKGTKCGFLLKNGNKGK